MMICKRLFFLFNPLHHTKHTYVPPASLMCSSRKHFQMVGWLTFTVILKQPRLLTWAKPTSAEVLLK